MKFCHLFLLISALFIFVGCNDEYTAKICGSEHRFDPANLEGTFHFTSRNENFEVEKQVMTFKRIDKGMYQINQDTRSLMEVCKVGNVVFTEAAQESQMWGLSILTVNADGVESVFSAFDKNKLDQLHIPYKVEERKNVGPIFNKSLASGKATQQVLVVDNSQTSAEVLVQALSPISVAIKLFR